MRTIAAQIRNPEKVLFEGEIVSLSSTNDTGPFDVLPLHENFICILKERVVIHLATGEQKEFPLETGILKVSEEKLSVFLGVETLASSQ